MSRFLLIRATTALLLLAVPAVSAAPGERLGRAADAVVDAGVRALPFTFAIEAARRSSPADTTASRRSDR